MKPTLARMIACIALAVCAAATAMAGETAPAKLPESTPGPVRSLFYEGESYQGKSTRVFAYYAVPAVGDTSARQQVPAVVLVHGGGGTAFREWCELWAKRGYAAIAMDLAGCRPIEGKNPHQNENRERLADGGPNQGDAEKFGSIDKPAGDQWPYHAVAAVLRAHSLIRSFPEVDAERTAVTGISWGGYLTCIVAGVDNRFKAAVPVYGCGFLHENSAWLQQLNKMSAEQRARWIELWDPSRYLPSVSMPILFVNGTNDFAYPLDSYMKSFFAVRGEKQIRITVYMPHGHPPGWAPQEIGLFVDHYLKRGPGLPVVGTPAVADGKLRMQVSGTGRVREASLHFSIDGAEINKHTWESRPAQVEGEIVSADAPPVNAAAWFLTVADERGAIVSSPVILKEPKSP